MIEPVHLRSRDNPLLVRLRKLARDPAGYRRAGAVWLEGDHLLRACLARGGRLQQIVVSESAWQPNEWAADGLQATRIAIVADALFADFSDLPSPARIGALIDLPAAPQPSPGMPAVVLDRLQDAGNVGSILRSAAALGIGQVLALHGTAALWSPKVLRAAMGAHFGLRLCEGLDPARLPTLDLTWLATGSHRGEPLHRAQLPAQCAWVFGHEGRGVAAELMARCERHLRIEQPGGEESLNVAAAAAICLYEWARQRAQAAGLDQ